MKAFHTFLLVLFSLYSLSGCSSTELASSLFKQHQRPQYKVGNPYVVDGKLYYPTEVASYAEEGDASWYGPGFHGRETANGEDFDTNDMTAAHRTLPMPSVVRVTNLQNGKSVVVRVNDRGPFRRDRIIDVSKSAAKALDFHMQGTTHVRVEFMPVESQIVAEAAKQGQILALSDVLARTGNNAGGHNAYDTASAAQPAQPIVISSLDSGTGHNATYQSATYQVPAPSAPANVLHEPISYHNPGQAAHAAAGAGRHPVQQAVYVQVGAYANRAHAAMVSKKLAKLGVADMDTVTRGGVKLYRVRLAATNHAAAQKIVSRAEALGFNGAKVMQE